MDKRYQVFVSSTYADLKEEREKVIQTLMEMDCIPSGMELFPAADEEQFAFIKRIIDDCDYYLLIIGGRYGSTTDEGISYTEQEYDYAIIKGLKVIDLLHGDPDMIVSGKTDQDPALLEKLNQFRAKIQRNRLIRYWKSIGELPGLVALSLSKTIKTYPAVGWVRATGAASSELLSEINALRKENEELKSKVVAGSQETPMVVENIAGMNESIDLYGVYKAEYPDNSELKWQGTWTWNEIFPLIAPYLLESPSDSLVKIKFKNSLFEQLNIKHSKSELNDQAFQTVKIQLIAYGLVETQYTKTTNDQMALFWNITDKGRALMIELRSIKKRVEPLRLDDSR